MKVSNSLSAQIDSPKRKYCGYGLAIFCTILGHFSAQAQNNNNLSTSVLSQKGSGAVVFPTTDSYTNEISTEASPKSGSGRRKTIALAQPPKAGEVPTLAADLNTAMMGPDMVKAMDDQYAARLRDFSMNNGFYASSQYSRRASATGRNAQEEAQIRKDMAKSIQRYMIVRGIPKFLATKPDTKSLAKTYNDVVVMTKVQGKTESRWEYKTGINPFQLRAFGNISKDGWYFETSTMYDKAGRFKLKDIYVAGNKTFASEKYSTGCNYEVFNKQLVPNIGHTFSKRLNAKLSTQLPLGAVYVVPASVTTLAMNYSF